MIIKSCSYHSATVPQKTLSPQELSLLQKMNFSRYAIQIIQNQFNSFNAQSSLILKITAEELKITQKGQNSWSSKTCNDGQSLLEMIKRILPTPQPLQMSSMASNNHSNPLSQEINAEKLHNLNQTLQQKIQEKDLTIADLQQRLEEVRKDNEKFIPIANNNEDQIQMLFEEKTKIEKCLENTQEKLYSLQLNQETLKAQIKKTENSELEKANLLQRLSIQEETLSQMLEEQQLSQNTIKDLQDRLLQTQEREEIAQDNNGRLYQKLDVLEKKLQHKNIKTEVEPPLWNNEEIQDKLEVYQKQINTAKKENILLQKKLAELKEANPEDEAYYEQLLEKCSFWEKQAKHFRLLLSNKKEEVKSLTTEFKAIKENLAEAEQLLS